MSEAKIFFGINHKYDLTLNDKLKSLSSLKMWDKGKKQYVYIYTIEKLKEIIELTNQITFPQKDIETLKKHENITSEEVPTDKWKGKSGYEVLETTNEYVVVEYQKPYKNLTPRKQKHIIPKERIQRLWSKVISELEENRPYKFENLARKTCKEFELHRFFRPKTDTFDKQKFQGSRGQGYFQYYYYPLCILIHLGLIRRNGQNITRIKNEWETQTLFKPL